MALTHGFFDVRDIALLTRNMVKLAPQCLAESESHRGFSRTARTDERKRSVWEWSSGKLREYVLRFLQADKLAQAARTVPLRKGARKRKPGLIPDTLRIKETH